MRHGEEGGGEGREGGGEGREGGGEEGEGEELGNGEEWEEVREVVEGVQREDVGWIV